VPAADAADTPASPEAGAVLPAAAAGESCLCPAATGALDICLSLLVPLIHWFRSVCIWHNITAKAAQVLTSQALQQQMNIACSALHGLGLTPACQSSCLIAVLAAVDTIELLSLHYRAPLPQ
jgi:hypothetical protein